jgi:hypothetical protein
VPEVGLVDRDATDHARLVQRLAGRAGEELVTFAERMREGLLAASVGIGLEVLAELMATEVTEVAGPRGKHSLKGRAAYRHGEQDGAVVLGGRKIAIRRPRVRSIDGAEQHLSSYDALTEVELLTEHTVAAMLAGLSTRRYAAALEPVGGAAERGLVGDLALGGVPPVRHCDRRATRGVSQHEPVRPGLADLLPRRVRLGRPHHGRCA